MSEEICERLEQDLEENERRASLMTVSYQYIQNKNIVNQSKSYAITTYKTEKVTEQCLNIVVKQTQQQPIAFLGLSAGKFIKAKGSENFMNFFKTSAPSSTAPVDEVVKESTTPDTFYEESQYFNGEVNGEIIEDSQNRQENRKHENKLHPPEKVEESVEEIDNIQNDPQIQRNRKTISLEKLQITKLQSPFDRMKVNRHNEVLQNKSSNLIENIEATNKAKSPFNKVKTSRKSSPCSKIQSTLKTDNFKQSFFMNILKGKQSEEDEIQDEEYEAPPIDNINNVHACDDSSNDSEKIEDNESLQVVASISKPQDKSPMQCNSIVLTKLQEIFPDLNDIDPEVLGILPFDLQDEAKKLLKAKEGREKDADAGKMKTKDMGKGSKIKNMKSKPKIQKCSIQNFFIKTDVVNDSDSNMKKCPQCGQLILVNKFEEHNDYHVAQNIQQQINRLSNGDESRKRKVNLDSPKHVKKRLSDEFVN